MLLVEWPAQLLCRLYYITCTSETFTSSPLTVSTMNDHQAQINYSTSRIRKALSVLQERWVQDQIDETEMMLWWKGLHWEVVSWHRLLRRHIVSNDNNIENGLHPRHHRMGLRNTYIPATTSNQGLFRVFGYRVRAPRTT